MIVSLPRDGSTEQANSQSMSSKDEQMTRPGVTNLKHVRKLVIRRHADLVRWGDPRLEGEMSAIKYVDACALLKLSPQFI